MISTTSICEQYRGHVLKGSGKKRDGFSYKFHLFAPWKWSQESGSFGVLEVSRGETSRTQTLVQPTDTHKCGSWEGSIVMGIRSRGVTGIWVFFHSTLDGDSVEGNEINWEIYGTRYLSSTQIFCIMKSLKYFPTVFQHGWSELDHSEAM